MASPTDLPPNVRRLVDEIESEIGETSVAIDDIAGSRGRDHEGESTTDNGKVEARSGGSWRRSARTPNARAWSGRRNASTGCTRS